MIDALSAEDQLRLNVLLSQELRAVRLDEGRLELRALTDKGEASMPLNPNCREDKYLRLVREALSGHALGSPGGFPVYLTRWTRHGQMDGANLARLLLIGEPEAVVAVVHSPALTDDLAEAAWWAMPTIDNARLMLRREDVARGRMGPILASFLVEHLPFLQDDHLGIMDTVAVLLRSGCLDDAGAAAIWRRGAQSNSHYVAFLEAGGDAIPGTGDAAEAPAALAALARDGNGLAARLLELCSAREIRFAEAALDVLTRPETQEVVSRALNALGAHYRLAANDATGEAAARRLAGAAPEWAGASAALRALGEVDESLVIPIFARSTAIGSLMRRKLEPVCAPLRAHLAVLLGALRAR
jgi:hypothetical protein